jgi:maltose alpha-D-glucosyltransferase/alpha-amylase
MIISICFAASSALISHASTRPEDLKVLKPWTRLWSRYASGIFVRAYLEAAGGADFVPGDRDELKLLLEIFLLDRSIHELGSRLDTSGSVEVPLMELRLLLDELKKEVV